MRTVSRLRLLFLLLRPGCPNPNGFYIAGLSISVLVTLSKLCRPIINTPEVFLQKYSQSNVFMVDLGGFAPPSRILFCLLHTVLTCILRLNYLNVKP